MRRVCASTRPFETSAPAPEPRRYAMNPTTADATHTAITATPRATCTATIARTLPLRKYGKMLTQFPVRAKIPEGDRVAVAADLSQTHLGGSRAHGRGRQDGPAFTLPSDSGEEVSLESLRGKPSSSTSTWASSARCS